ncbi:MAG: GNAT family N-acetyltransferase [Spirochaetales bacterium]|nr:GNAT family N-acetyltransferase [Spirochaetales bacterium]
MTIEYSDRKDISTEQLERLFLSVMWESGMFPAKLVQACQHSDTVFSAWAGRTLVGLCSAVTDHSFFVYIHWLLVMPEYQKQGIGKKLLGIMQEKYTHIPRIILSSYTAQKEFYVQCGFQENTETVPMIKSNQI